MKKNKYSLKILLIFVLALFVFSPSKNIFAQTEITLEENKDNNEQKKLNINKKDENSSESDKNKQEEKKKETTKDSSSEKDIVQNRQFITLEAETGKEFVLVVDYYKNKKEVKFLTELNEDDLKTLIKVQNAENNFSSKLKESKENTEETTKKTEEKKKEITKENKNEEKKKTSKSKDKPNILSYIVLVVLLASLGVVIYFKKFKKN